MNATLEMQDVSAPASSRRREFEAVCEALERHDHQPSRLIPILQEVQAAYRYLPEEVLTYVATALGLSPAHVYGVATFYSQFTLKPKGKYVLRICDGTACHVRNSTGLYEAICGRLGLDAAHPTTPDLLFTLETVSCLGACGLAPVMMVNEDVHGLVTPAKAVSLIEAILESEEVHVSDSH